MTLSCVSDGNPPPRYQWHNTLTEERYSGTHYVIDICNVTSQYNAANMTVLCEATNDVSSDVEHDDDVTSVSLYLDALNISCGKIALYLANHFVV